MDTASLDSLSSLRREHSKGATLCWDKYTGSTLRWTSPVRAVSSGGSRRGVAWSWAMAEEPMEAAAALSCAALSPSAISGCRLEGVATERWLCEDWSLFRESLVTTAVVNIVCKGKQRERERDGDKCRVCLCRVLAGSYLSCGCTKSCV